MGYYDDPIVDENAKRSEESVNAVKSFFTRKNGFISREEIPDYGVDFDVELIYDGSKASSKKFAIQLKSSQSLDIITHGKIEFVSLQFKTSRLGYLARRDPGYGIIVVYDESSGICFFDYVEDIVERLDAHSGKLDWRDQQTVNLHIPLNKLENQVLVSLHKRYRKRFENSLRLLEKHGPEFNIPVLIHEGEKLNESKIDFDDPSSMAELLEKHGAMLFNEHEFAMLHQMLGRVSKNHIDNSPELIFLAAITYTQVGQMVEAEYYIRKANKRSAELSDEKLRLISFSQIRVDFLKGDIDYAEFQVRLKKLAEQINDIENQLVIEVNILLFELADLREDLKAHSVFEKKLSELFERIASADIPIDKKQLLNVYYSEILHTYSVGRFMTDFVEYKVKESLGFDIPVASRIKLAGDTVAMIQTATGIAISAYKYAKDKNLLLLEATSQSHLGKYFFSFQFSLIAVGQEELLSENKDEILQSYITNINYCLNANNVFQDLNMFQNAYEALGTAYQLLVLGHRLTGIYAGERDPQEFQRIMGEMQNAFDLPPYEDLTNQFVGLGKDKNPDGNQILKDASDEKIEMLARGVLKGYDLPESRLVNIIHEMKMIRSFQQKCSNPNIELLYDFEHLESKTTAYAFLPKCILFHKLIGFRTSPSSDIDFLLEQMSTIIGKGSVN